MNGRGSILVVDDTPESLRVLAGVLEQEGYRVRPANSGELALASIAAQPPDLILLDIRMPGMDGFEVCRRLKADETTGHIPVIFQSAATDLADRLEGLRLGAVDFISKPFQREELLARVKTHLELALLRRDLEAVVKERTAQLESEIVERTRAEEEIRLNLNRQKALLGVYQEIPTASIPEIIALVVERCVDLTGSALGFVGFISDDDQRMEAQIWSEMTMKNCPLDTPVEFLLSKGGLWAEPVRQGRVITVHDFREENPLKKGYPEGHLELVRFLGVPVIDNGRVVAVAGVANKQDNYAQADQYTLSLLLEGMWELIKRKRAEEQQHHLELQMLHAQKLESLGVLAGGIAHDFNNILTSIIGNADLAQLRLSPESPVLENIKLIEKSALRAADLAKQMLAYSGKGKFVIKDIDMNQLLEEMMYMLEVSISKKAVMKFNPTRPLPTVEGDATQIQQVVMNLVINASEAIGDKSGVIAITTGSMMCERNYLKEAWFDDQISDGLYVYLEITDTGCGMDKETINKMFEPFFTTKFTGRGLGMSAVLGIIHGHKGTIRVYSEPGNGTMFKILLPASSKPSGLFGNDCHYDDGWKGSGTVLLVDDEATVRCIGSEMLKELGFNVITANDGQEAILEFTNNPDIRFVILDLTMPHIDGEQCFHELRQIKPDIKVIMSSGYSEQEVTQRFIDKGLAGFIQKPYRISALEDVIRKTLTTEVSSE
jgi:CheY-like chemotaxis protein